MPKQMAVIGLSLLALVSCKQPAPPPEVHAKAYDGRTLFRGLVFFEGDLADSVKLWHEVKQLNRLDSLNKYQMTAFNGYKDYTTKFIEKYHPDFFDAFGAMIQSGNPILVEAGLRQAGDLVLESWALKPVLMLGRADLKGIVLSEKSQAALQELATAKTIQEVKDMLANRDFAKNLIINEARDLDLDIRLDNQLMIDRYRNLDYFIFHNLDYALTTNAFVERTRILNVATQLQRAVSYNRMFNLQFDKDIDLGAGSWFNENEWLNENRYVNNNENFNVDKNVNVKEDVSVVVEAVVAAVIGLHTIGAVDEKAQFLHEELVRQVTERFALGPIRVGRAM